MRNARLSFAVQFSMVLTAAVAAASVPEYGPSSLITCGGDKLDVGNHGSPCVTDWDGDGLKDLIVGQFDYGMIRVYINVGTNSDPAFDSYGWLSADGDPIMLPYG